jgi:glycosyltransferase involved in cell wall biosynthesis
LARAPVGDRYFYWARSARKPALELARRSGACAIYASASPYNCLLLGLWLKGRTGLPLVADFRDPWTLVASDRLRGIRARADRYFERKVLRLADAVIATHPMAAAQFEEIEPACRGRLELIPNGYDPADFAGSAPESLFPGLVHVGCAYEQSPLPVLRALATLKSDGRLPPEFRTVFVGGVPPSSMKIIQDLHLEETVQVRRRVAHQQAVAEMRSAAVLLLLLHHTGNRMPAKIYEYMAAGRPVLCITSSQPCIDLLRRSGIGLALPPGDLSAIENAIIEMTADPQEWASRNHRPNTEMISGFDRARLTARLAGILDRVAAGRARPPWG